MRNYFLQNEIKELKENIVKSTEIIAKIKSQQDGIQNKWANAKLSGSPAKDQLENARKLLSTFLNILNVAKISLEKTGQEISRYRSAENYQKLDREVKNKITVYTEDVYLKNLQDQLKADDE